MASRSLSSVGSLCFFQNDFFQASKDDFDEWFLFSVEHRRRIRLESLLEFINFLEEAGVLRMESPVYSNMDNPTTTP